MKINLLHRIVAISLLSVPAIAAPTVSRAQNVTIFAAASLKNALDDVIAAWKQSGDGTAVASYASSSTLAKQIEQGAPADIFISADKQWMDYVVQRMLVATPHNLLGNRLVLVAPKANMATIDIKPGFDLAKALGGGRLAVGDPSNVPAGIYAKEALTKLGVWASIEPKLAPAADVRAALALVSRGEAPLGIVYETDAKVEPSVRIAGIFPEDTHSPINYPIAAVATSKNADTPKFIAFASSAAAKTIFEHYGFSVLAP